MGMQADKLRLWSAYREPEHELVGKLQLYIMYSTSADDNSNLKVSYLQRVLQLNHLYIIRSVSFFLGCDFS